LNSAINVCSSSHCGHWDARRIFPNLTRSGVTVDCDQSVDCREPDRGGGVAVPWQVILEVAMQDSAAAYEGDAIAADETDRLIASNKVEGTTVYNRTGEHLGEVYNFMVDKYSGQVAYAVMSFGGFLGIGEKYHPLPWKVLTYDTGLGGYVVDLDEETLRGAPIFDRNESPEWGSRDWDRRIHDYYRLPYEGGI
jgi:PRC-barrel domain